MGSEHGSALAMKHDQREHDERERQALEMLYAGAVQAYAWAPRESATWLAVRALLPDLEFRLRAVGGLAEQPRPAGEQTHRSA
jgi:hypothetical protein